MKLALTVPGAPAIEADAGPGLFTPLGSDQLGAGNRRAGPPATPLQRSPVWTGVERPRKRGSDRGQ
ncbi:MAG TPA: hypothetical protein VM913_05800 [Sphingomicrobium sp.]|nr:hypothetical protein [Sphingomicrobium sp.]